MKTLRSSAVGLCLLLALLSSCREEPQSSQPQRLVVAVSVIPQAWLVRQIAGEEVDVITLIRPGESPATYQPSDRQITEVMRAGAYFRIGVPAENGPWFDAIAGSGPMRIVDTREGIDLRPIEGHEHHDGHDQGEKDDREGNDPHIWLSPRLLRIQAATIARTLSELDAEHAVAYRSRLVDLEKVLDELDGALRAKLDPIRGAKFFVFHPSWGYFADEYDLQQVAIEVEGKLPSDREMTELRNRAREAGATVVFIQPQISAEPAQAVVDAIGGRAVTLDPLAEDVAANLLRVADAIVESTRP